MSWIRTRTAKKLDVDGDNMLTFKEFAAGFDLFDTNGHGTIDTTGVRGVRENYCNVLGEYHLVLGFGSRNFENTLSAFATRERSWNASSESKTAYEH